MADLTSKDNAPILPPVMPAELLDPPTQAVTSPSPTEGRELHAPLVSDKELTAARGALIGLIAFRTMLFLAAIAVLMLIQPGWAFVAIGSAAAVVVLMLVGGMLSGAMSR